MITAADIARALGDSLLAKSGPCGSIAFQRLVIDSRQVEAGDLFIALPGDHHDGHQFIEHALARGATGLIVRTLSQPLSDGITAFRVDDTLAALQRIATHWRNRHQTEVIGVTGSVGKTTCKELIALVLEARFRVLKSEGNLNTEIGLPLTLLQLSEEHQRAILEMGMYAQGDIRLLCQIARPHIGVVTNVGPVHLERLGSIEAIAAAKAELVESLPADGWAILNGDDPLVAAMKDKTAAQVLLYGTSPHCHVRGSQLVSRGLEGIAFRLTYGESSIDIESRLLGRHSLPNALAAAAVGIVEGLSLAEIAEALARPDMPNRARIVPGINGCTVIDDSYNASPASMLGALDLLSELPGRRIALLGDMRELGAAEEQGHRQVGQRAATATDMLYVVGERGRIIGQAAQEAGHLCVDFPLSTEAAAELLRSQARPGDFILVKASRSMSLEKVVERLTE